MQEIRTNADNDIMHALYPDNRLPAGKGISRLNPEEMERIKSLLIEVMWYNGQQMKMQNERIRNKAIQIMDYLQTHYATD